jgi:hypothetical protein
LDVDADAMHGTPDTEPFEVVQLSVRRGCGTAFDPGREVVFPVWGRKKFLTQMKAGMHAEHADVLERLHG